MSALLLFLLVSAVSSKSAKRGIAYDGLKDEADFRALSPGVSWWYDWYVRPNTSFNFASLGMDYVPMLWNGKTDQGAVRNYLNSIPQNKRFLLAINEPSLTSQANMSVEKVVDVWPSIERLAESTGAKLVGPQLTWGSEFWAPYNDPVKWLERFYQVFRSRNGRDPRIDFLGFHWYDYGLAGQLDKLTKFGKKFWVSEMANMHNYHDGADIDTLEKQRAQLADMVRVCESRSDVARYAWFTGRLRRDPHYVSLLAGPGQLTPLGQDYVNA